MRGDGEEEWGRDANATRWDPLQLLSRRGPALSHPYSAPAQPQPCPGTWAGLGKGDGAALAQTKQARGFRGKHHSRLLLWHHRFCGQTRGWGRKEATALCSSAGFSLMPSAWLLLGSSPSTHTGSPTALQTRETLPHPPCKHQLAVGLLPCQESACSC